nr:DNA helicase RecG [Streptococcus anginosus]
MFSDSVAFKDLGVVIVDEQHRFGVEQRDTLRTSDGGRSAHQLVMTATPIPRTVAMTVFGDLEETRMAGMPAGRMPVQTFLVDSANSVWMERLWTRAHEEIE